MADRQRVNFANINEYITWLQSQHRIISAYLTSLVSFGESLRPSKNVPGPAARGSTPQRTVIKSTLVPVPDSDLLELRTNLMDKAGKRIVLRGTYSLSHRNGTRLCRRINCANPKTCQFFHPELNEPQGLDGVTPVKEIFNASREAIVRQERVVVHELWVYLKMLKLRGM